MRLLSLLAFTTMLLTGVAGCTSFERMRLANSRIVPTTVALAPDGRVLLAPSDWGELAHAVSYQMLQRATQSKELAAKPIFVAAPLHKTAFEIALYQFLQSELAELGLIVAQKPDNTVRLEYDVQAVQSATGMDVVVTTAIGNGYRYLFRHSEVYRVNPADARLYDAALLVTVPPPVTPVKKIIVTGDK